ncbi:MAG: helix-turn-helix domain-containing protein [Desulfovibrio sp.]|uniref:winged helix-turn-helix transcriptional regulator n=1 Tax=Desulfovibrio sp. TaxID=885 RepID=UPI0039E41B50
MPDANPDTCPDACKVKVLGNKPYRCGFELTLDLIGGKWKLLIIYFLAGRPVLRYGELRRCLPEVSERMLVKQLRELEQDGIVHRKVYGTVPPRVEYSLTEAGVSLIPIMNSLRDWGDGYDEKMQARIASAPKSGTGAP